MGSTGKLMMIVRAWSLPMTVISVSFAAAYTFYSLGWLDPVAYVLVVIGTVLLHSSVNVLNDYYDTVFGVDRDGAPTTKYRLHPIIHGLTSGNKLLAGGLASLAGGLAIAAYLVILGGPIVLALGATGAFLAYAYTGPPFKLKYRALGEIAVFLAWGPLMALGTYMVLVHGLLDVGVAYASVPIGLLIAAVLLANNLRDVDFDRSVGVKTLATLFGVRKGIDIYAGLLFGAYIIQVAMIFAGLLPVASLIALVTLPKAVQLVRIFSKGVPEASDPMTAQLVLLYGVLYAIGTAIGGL